MASDPPGGPSDDDPSDAGPARDERLTRLDARLAAARKAVEPKGRSDEHFSQANQAWRMVIEMVSGLGLGFGIGYGLDVLFGTMPMLMVVFTLLGLAAGVKTMMRTADEMGQARLRAEAAAAEDAGADRPANNQAATAAEAKQAEDTARQEEGR